jgi:hypothetical protein
VRQCACVARLMEQARACLTEEATTKDRRQTDGAFVMRVCDTLGVLV